MAVSFAIPGLCAGGLKSGREKVKCSSGRCQSIQLGNAAGICDAIREYMFEFYGVEVFITW